MNTNLNELIQRVGAGAPGAQNALFAASYPELCKLARSRLRDGGRNTLMDTTVLVHESYMRCLRGLELQRDDRQAFFGYASQVMRSVIVDTVRRRRAERRGGDQMHQTLDTHISDSVPQTEQEALHVHEALQALQQAEPRLAEVVEMRYYGGYSEAEIAQAMGVTERTVRRDWQKARLLLLTLLTH